MYLLPGEPLCFGLVHIFPYSFLVHIHIYIHIYVYVHIYWQRCAILFAFAYGEAGIILEHNFLKSIFDSTAERPSHVSAHTSHSCSTSCSVFNQFCLLFPARTSDRVGVFAVADEAAVSITFAHIPTPAFPGCSRKRGRDE